MHVTCKQILEDSSSNDNIAVTTYNLCNATQPECSGWMEYDDTMSTLSNICDTCISAVHQHWAPTANHPHILCQLFHLSKNGDAQLSISRSRSIKSWGILGNCLDSLLIPLNRTATHRHGLKLCADSSQQCHTCF